MKNKNNDLRGTPWVARQLKTWLPSESPDLILATTQYVAEEWLENRETPSEAVYSIYAAARDLGARGDTEAAVIACALQTLLEQQGCLSLSFSHVKRLRRRRGDLLGRRPH